MNLLAEHIDKIDLKVGEELVLENFRVAVVPPHLNLEAFIDPPDNLSLLKTEHPEQEGTFESIFYLKANKGDGTMRLLICCCLFLSMLMGCGAPVDVKTQVGQDVVFTTLKAYSWLDTDSLAKSPVPITNPKVDEAVRDAVDKNLLKKGYQRINAGDPDFLVAWFGGDANPITNVGKFQNQGIEVRCFSCPFFGIFNFF